MSPDGTVIVTANYFPPGNYNNAYSENVFQPNGQPVKNDTVAQPPKKNNNS